MKYLIPFLLLCSPVFLVAQNRPSYCDELPQMYEKGATPQPDALPTFNTKATIEYKVQVALLKKTDPKKYPFHQSLIARYRPCEQVWVVESRESFKDRKSAEKMKEELAKLGYKGSYITEIVGYQ